MTEQKTQAWPRKPHAKKHTATQQGHERTLLHAERVTLFVIHDKEMEGIVSGAFELPSLRIPLDQKSIASHLVKLASSQPEEVEERLGADGAVCPDFGEAQADRAEEGMSDGDSPNEDMTGHNANRGTADDAYRVFETKFCVRY